VSSPTTTAHERLVDALRDHGSTVNESGDRATATCPAHDDGRASLSIGPRNDGKGVVLYCHADCDYRDVLAALKFSPRDLFDDDGMRAAYSDRTVHRAPGKKFRQSGNTKGNSLFHADKIGAAHTVYVTEGEKDVLAAESVGAGAVCPAMGVGKAPKFDWSPLKGKHVNIVADRDEPGHKHAAEIAELLRGVAASVRIVEAAVGKDLADHIAAGKTLDELMDLTPRTTAQPRNRARHKRCPRLRGCPVSSTPWPMKCSTAAWSARNSWRGPCT
jgi:hypothetical protein